MSSKAVNRPVDLKVKETDVNNKLQLYGIYSGELHLQALMRRLRVPAIQISNPH